MVPFVSPTYNSVLLSFQQRVDTRSLLRSFFDDITASFIVGLKTTRQTFPSVVDNAIAFSSGDINTLVTAPFCKH